MKIKYLLFLLFFAFNFCWSQEQFSVYFESNKFELTKSENTTLQTWINQNKTSKVVGVYGFCDEDGSTQYNDTLASKRINFVFQIIKNKVKVRDDFKTRSFGELHNQSETKAKNRKVTLYFLKEKDIPREAEILGLKSKEVVKIKQPISFPASVTIDNPNGSKTEIPLDVKFMESINTAKAGEKLKVDNLNFLMNSYAITAESRSRLYELLTVMQSNTNLKISIQGHLCCMTADKKDLSTQRAKAVCKFLEINGIDKSRITYKGFGVSNPLFPIPEKTEEERTSNRRVEIEIIEN